MDIKSALGGGIVVAVAAAGLLFAGEKTKPAEKVGLSPDEHAVAVEVCKRPETTITLVKTPQGQHFEGKYDVTGETRYDLTWQPDGTAIAVEKLKGRDQEVWAEQMTPEFQACVNAKEIKQREAAH